MNFLELKKELHETAKKNPDDFGIEEETETSITIWDYMDKNGPDRTYTLTDPDSIDSSYYKERFVVTPDAEKLPVDYEKVSDYLSDYLDPALTMNLNKIVFTTPSEEDFDFLLKTMIDTHGNPMCEYEDPATGKFGIFWYENSIVVINVGMLYSYLQEIYIWDVEEIFNEELMLTILHELRHLAQANPYLPEDIKLLSDPEEDAEQFARKHLQEHPVIVVSDLSEEIESEL